MAYLLKNLLEKGEQIYGTETLFRETGWHLLKLEKYAKALKYFDKAVEKNAFDKWARIGRAKAREKTSQQEGALEDINKALSVNPDDLDLLAYKTLCIYLCSEFEEALLQNARLLPLREKPDCFKLGTYRCLDAIENCIAERAGHPLRDHFKIIREIGWKRNYKAQRPFEPVAKKRLSKKKCKEKRDRRQLLGSDQIVQPIKLKSNVPPKKPPSSVKTGDLQILDSLHSKLNGDTRIPPFTQKFSFHPLQNHTTNLENYMAERYLDKMYLDKKFLKEFPRALGARCPNKEGSKKLKEIAKNCYNIVNEKQENLRSRRPFYFIKYQEAKISGSLKERQIIELEQRRQIALNEASAIHQKLIAAYQNKRLKECLHLIEKLKAYCDGKSKKLLPNKQQYMDAIYETACKAFYDVYRIDPDQSLYEQNRRIYATLGIPLSRTSSADSFMKDLMDMKFVDVKKQINLFETRLKEAASPEEACWLYHECARYQLDQKKYEVSRFYAKKCIREAKLGDNNMWVFNCLMLMCKCNLLQHNPKDAKSDLQRAFEITHKLQDSSKEHYVNRCMDLVENAHFANESIDKMLGKRENEIVQMMASSKMKEEVTHLFKQMSSMPASRRMTVIPGAVVSDSKGPTRMTKMSIIPRQGENTNASITEMKEMKRSMSTSRQSQGKNILEMLNADLYQKF